MVKGQCKPCGLTILCTDSCEYHKEYGHEEKKNISVCPFSNSYAKWIEDGHKDLLQHGVADHKGR